MKNSLVYFRFKYILLHFIVCIFTLVYVKGLHEQMNFKLMYLFALWSIFVYVRLILLEIKYTSGLTLVLFYLIGCLLRVGIGCYYLSIKSMNQVNIFYIYNYVSDVIFPTAIWMNLTYMLFLGTFTYFTRNMNTNIDFSGYVRKYNTMGIAILIYIIAYVFLFFNLFRIAPALNVLMSQLYQVAILIIMFTCVYKNKRANFIVFILIISIEVLRAIFFNYYKTSIIMPVLFIVLYFYLKAKHLHKPILSFNLITVTLSLFLFLLFFVYPFMNEKRNRSGFDPVSGKGTKEYSNVAIIEDVLTGKIVYEEGNETSEQFVNRVDAIITNAFFYKNAHRYKKYMKDILYNSLIIFIPKILYPDKPLNISGLMATSIANHGTINTIDETTYTFIGLFASMYMIGGLFAVVLFSFLNGFVYAKIYGVIIRYLSNPFSLLLLLRLMLESYTAYEETTSAGIASWISYLVYLILIFITNIILFTTKKKKYVLK